MLSQQQDVISERGGIAVRDFTHGDPKMPLGRTGANTLERSLARVNFDRVARRLGWLSLGLGLMELLMPRRVQKLAGVPLGDFSTLIRAAGVRELMHGLLIFMQARPHQAMWTRVAGDALDLSVLAAATQQRCVDQPRLATAMAAVAGISALDLVTAVQLRRQRAEERRFSTLTRRDLGGKTKSGAFRAVESITINRSPDALYQFWRNFEHLPEFMYHLEQVEVLDQRRSRWQAKAPAGADVSWEAEITDDRPNELIAWQSLPGAQVPNSGLVTFEPGPAGRGTVVRVEIEYRPPGGSLGRLVAQLFGEEPKQQVAGDLRRFKQVMETGEVLRSEGSPRGFGQKRQRPARPLPAGGNGGRRGPEAAQLPTEQTTTQQI
jgi:uncharacterized membrane protein